MGKLRVRGLSHKQRCLQEIDASKIHINDTSTELVANTTPTGGSTGESCPLLLHPLDLGTCGAVAQLLRVHQKDPNQCNSTDVGSNPGYGIRV